MDQNNHPSDPLAGLAPVDSDGFYMTGQHGHQSDPPPVAQFDVRMTQDELYALRRALSSYRASLNMAGWQKRHNDGWHPSDDLTLVVGMIDRIGA